MCGVPLKPQIRIVRPSELTPGEVALLGSMTLRDPESDLNRTLRSLHSSQNLDPTVRIIMAEPHGRLAGWATAEIWPYRKYSVPLINVFVRPTMRGLGVGTRLRRIARSVVETLVRDREPKTPLRCAERQILGGCRI